MTPTRPAEPTVPRPPDQDQPGDPWQETQVKPVPAVALQPVSEIQQLLQKRLRFLSLLMTGGLIVNVLMVVGTGAAVDAGTREVPPAWAYFGVGVFGVGTAAGVVLWVRRSLSLRQLRAIELILFGALYAHWLSVHAFIYPRLVLFPQPPVWYGPTLAHAVSTPWSILIILYGILIPNTWRRCAAVVGVMAVTPLVISVANGLAAQVTEGHSPLNYLSVVGFWMAVSAAIAVYGSHRIDVLRREVAEAHRLGPYGLVRKLGEGGMGEVWLAEHRLLKRPCAVKFIRPELASNPAVAARFEREVQAVTGLTHFNTVRVYDYGRADDGSFYYVMEYLDGPTLGRLVRDHGPLEPGRAVYLLRQLCGAISEAHAAGLVHRDIKPGNVLVTALGGQYDVAKLLDFGLVQDLSTVDGGDRLTAAGVVMGTPAYLCPEQASGSSAVDARGDVYSLGAVAFFALTGLPPFERATLGEYLTAHLTQEPPDLRDLRADVPADLAAVVARCLAKNPTERFQSALELDRALAECHCASNWSADRAARWWDKHPDSSKLVGMAPTAIFHKPEEI
ncbi:MAG: serine/threonine protein kinase [Planctomycetia bacterium]|nr:serine/threonine protein kinase [Planctomycetia bacterium]